MALARAALLITAVGSVAYAIGLLAMPGLLADLNAGPEQTSWIRYLVPIYLGIGVVAWTASTDPARMSMVAWGVTVIWAGLAVAHVVNMTLGDEPVIASTVGLLLFDCAMAVALVIGLNRLRSADSAQASI